MIHYVPICFILALLGTLLVNPTMYYHFFSMRLKCKKEKAKNPNSLIHKPASSLFCGVPIFLILGQSIAFVLIFTLCILGFYTGVPMAVQNSLILAYLWVPGILQFVNWFVYHLILDENSSFDCYISDSIYHTCLILAGLFIATSIAVGIHTSVYNYLHTYDDVTFMEEVYEDYPFVDETTLLQTANLAAGSIICSPICRYGYWIYPIAHSSSNVASSGYLVVDAYYEKIYFVPKDISYSPWLSTANNVQRVVRRYAPSAVFFGDVSLQIEPKTREIYFAQFYGDYVCFRAGRKVEGVILVNASSGKCKSYLLGDIPDWVTGVSF